MPREDSIHDDAEDDGQSTYVVQRGDTLAGVALKLGVTKSELKRANHMYGTISLMTGQTLRVGSRSKSSRSLSGEALSRSSSSGVAAGSESDSKSSEAAPPALAAKVCEKLGTSKPEVTPEPGPEVVAETRKGAGTENAKASNIEASSGVSSEVGAEALDARAARDAVGSGSNASDQVLFVPKGWGAGIGQGSGSEGLLRPTWKNAMSSSSLFEIDDSMVRSNRNVSFSAVPLSTWSGSITASGGDAWAGDDELAEDRPRAASTTQALLSLVNPNFWGSRERRDGSNVESAIEESARLGGAAGPEDGESQAAAERRRTRSRSEAELEESEPPEDPPGLDSDITHILSFMDASEADGPEDSNKLPHPLPGLVAGGSSIVTHETIGRMEMVLPKHYRGYKWYLLYSTFRDGASYIQFYNRLKDEEPTYLVVENMHGEVFGGFATGKWASTSKYYGTGECFLYSMNGTRVKKSGVDQSSPATDGGGGGGEGDGGASRSQSTANGVREKEREDEDGAPSTSESSPVATNKTLISSPLPRPKLDASRSPTGPMRTGFQRTRGGSLDEDDTAGYGGKDDATTAVAVGNRSLLEGHVTTHGWSGINTYFQYSDDKGIGMGGGGGSFGLFVGDDLLSGTTGACATFDNPPLCSKEAFEVSQLEVWGFTTASTEVGARMERLRKTLRGRTTRPLG